MPAATGFRERIRREPRQFRALLGGPRISLDDADRRERDPEDRSGRPRHPVRRDQGLRRHRRQGDLRRPGLQVPDLGAGPLRGLPGRGQEPVARHAEAAGSRPPRDGRDSRAGNEAGRGTRRTGAAGGPARHVPVLLEEVMRFLAPAAGGTFIDGTFGARRLQRAPSSIPAPSVIAIDRDPTAIAAGAALKRAAGDRLTLVEGRFSDLDAIARDAWPRAASTASSSTSASPRCSSTTPARGFSFRNDGPLDMRMGADGPTAADVVNGMEQRDLARVIAVLGEEKRARAVASRHRSGARAAEPDPARSSLPRSSPRAVGRRGADAIHPATRTFQALRIFVNRELDELAEALAASERMLARRRPARRRRLPFARGPHRQALPRRPLRRARAAARAMRRSGSVAPPTFELLTRGAVAPGEARSRPIRGRARRGCARRGAPAPRRGRSTREPIGVPGVAALSRTWRSVTMGRIINFVLLALMVIGAGVTYDMKHDAETAARPRRPPPGRDRQGEGGDLACSRPSGACSPSRAACRRSSSKYADHFQLAAVLAVAGRDHRRDSAEARRCPIRPRVEKTHRRHRRRRRPFEQAQTP